MTEQGIRFDQLLKALKINEVSFAQVLGLSQSYVNRIHNGKSRISGNVAEIIGKKFPDVNITWLITGKGDMFSTGVKEKPAFIKGIRKGIPKVDELELIGILSENLRTIADRWEMFHYELFDLLGARCPPPVGPP